MLTFDHELLANGKTILILTWSRVRFQKLDTLIAHSCASGLKITK